jgi:hypothetical protein
MDPNHNFDEDHKPDEHQGKQDTSPVFSESGINEKLKPCLNLVDMFADMTRKALENGFADVLKMSQERCLKVATMCSGTESPVMALQMIANGKCLS